MVLLLYLQQQALHFSLDLNTVSRLGQTHGLEYANLYIKWFDSAQKLKDITMNKTPKYKIPKLTKAEKALVATINSQWDKSKALYELTSHLQIAATIELATIPIYLNTYYSINRTPGKDTPYYTDAFPKSDLSRFADRAGALIMSVAVEEMLHMSLSSNVLYSLGEDPKLYQQAPGSYPATLPGHNQNVSPSSPHFSQNIPIPLARFSFTQLSHFLAIEYPAPVGAPPEAGNWDTIGQIYSYVRCIIESDWIEDQDFQVRHNRRQIAATEYSPNNIDTIYPEKSFDFIAPKPAPTKHSAAKVAEYANKEDSHTGANQLLTISSCEDALQAIATICFQGEGFAHEAYDDPSEGELSHYYKFLQLQSEINGYTEQYVKLGKELKNNVAPLPPAPEPAAHQYSPADLDTFVYPYKFNPNSQDFGKGRGELVDIADGLFQYMLIMTETIYRIPEAKQKIYFNRSMHQSMIWVMDKFLQAIREIKTADGRYSLSATWANINLGERKSAHASLCSMVNEFQSLYVNPETGDPTVDWLTKDAAGYLNSIKLLPDVSVFWQETAPTPEQLTALDYLHEPTEPRDKGQNTKKPKPYKDKIDGGPYAGLPRWPLNPPKDDELPEGALRHACMGLNSCKNQGRTLDNECAGQGYCSTALAYNAADPNNPGISDHTCHVLNDCRGQGGCGLYGTEEELAAPGYNECQSKGSCATPINAERFITDGDLRGESVWVQARAVFTDKVWPEVKKANPDKNLPKYPPEVPGSDKNPNVFKYGPTIEWIETDNGGAGMTACGASGMSGAGSCA